MTETMRKMPKPYNDIPGTTVFDADMARKGHHLNQFAMSLMKAENRERWLTDEPAYLDDWPMTAEQLEAVLERDFNRMISLGGNIYYLAKIFSTDKQSFLVAAAKMTGVTPDEYYQMMVNGGRSPKGNLYKPEVNNGEAE
ncbi:MAG: protocatechuate 4,5-dioxygenase subunit alpha [Thiolinea sp.]